MEYLLILLVTLVILAYAFRVDQWDMWVSPKWETIKSFNATGDYGNAFTTRKVSTIVRIQKATNKKEVQLRCQVNMGNGFKGYNLDKLYIEMPELREFLIENGYKI